MDYAIYSFKPFFPFLQSSAMKAVQQANPGDADTLFIDGVHPRPEPKDREIVIEVFNSAVNRLDILQVSGLFVL